MSKICAVTGSFDPVTVGHVNIAERAAKIFDKVFVLMLVNPDKKYLFSVEQRLKMLKKAFANKEKIEVAYFDGFTVDFCKEHSIDCLVRGLRNHKDFDYEIALAKANFEYGGIETFFLDASEEFCDVSSQNVRKLITEGKTFEGLVPNEIISTIKEIEING